MSEREPSLREAFAKHQLAQAKANAELAKALVDALPSLMQAAADYWNRKAEEAFRKQVEK